jgi:hypothetical protein
MELNDLPIDHILLKKETGESDSNFFRSINEVLEEFGLIDKMQSPKDPNAHLYSGVVGGATAFYGDFSYDNGTNTKTGDALIVYQGFKNWMDVNSALHARD